VTLLLPDQVPGSVSYSTRICKRCGGALEQRRSGVLGRTVWRCGRCNRAAIPSH